MQFTEKEIELSKQLKEAGLEWKLEEGDWYFGEDGEIILFTGAYDVIRRKDTWLPLWHECRNIILEKGWILRLLFDTPPQVEWRIHIVYEQQIEKHTHTIEATGETDLEAIYKALLEVLKNRER